MKTSSTDLTVFKSNSGTMCSIEIAAFCGKMHKNVLTDIHNMLISLGLPPAENSAFVPQAVPNGGIRNRKVFNLSKELTLSLVSGYDVVARNKIIKRWLELEGESRKQLPQDHIDAVRAYLVTLETVKVQQEQIVEQIEIIQHKEIITNDSETYFPILHARQRFPSGRFNGSILNRVSESIGLPSQQLFTTGKLTAINTYHRDVWKVVYPEVVL
jgi:phage regulator Rha-like protein